MSVPPEPELEPVQTQALETELRGPLEDQQCSYLQSHGFSPSPRLF